MMCGVPYEILGLAKWKNWNACDAIKSSRGISKMINHEIVRDEASHVRGIRFRKKRLEMRHIPTIHWVYFCLLLCAYVHKVHGYPVYTLKTQLFVDDREESWVISVSQRNWCIASHTVWQLDTQRKCDHVSIFGARQTYFSPQGLRGNRRDALFVQLVSSMFSLLSA